MVDRSQWSQGVAARPGCEAWDYDLLLAVREDRLLTQRGARCARGGRERITPPRVMTGRCRSSRGMPRPVGACPSRSTAYRAHRLRPWAVTGRAPPSTPGRPLGSRWCTTEVQTGPHAAAACLLYTSPS